jgi:hypothetical protein
VLPGHELRSPPTFAVLTDWLSTLVAPGIGSRAAPTCWRKAPVIFAKVSSTDQ